MDTAADMQLVEALELGSQAAWTQVVTQHRSRLLSQFSRYHSLQTRYGHSPEDLLQEFWIRIPTRLKSYNGRAPLGYWLRLQGLSIAGDLLRSRKGQGEIWNSPRENWEDWLGGHSDTPEAIVLAIELGNACNLFHEMASLPALGTHSLPTEYRVTERHKRYVNNWINR